MTNNSIGDIMMERIDKVMELLYLYKEEQLHFFWSFTLSILGHWVWPPLIFTGLVATGLKELWDYSNFKHLFSWKDIVFGSIGWITAILVVI